jgi:hypothetical protein
MINPGILALRVANWPPKFDGILFWGLWGQNKAIMFRVY